MIENPSIKIFRVKIFTDFAHSPITGLRCNVLLSSLWLLERTYIVETWPDHWDPFTVHLHSTELITSHALSSCMSPHSPSPPVAAWPPSERSTFFDYQILYSENGILFIYVWRRNAVYVYSYRISSQRQQILPIECTKHVLKIMNNYHCIIITYYKLQWIQIIMDKKKSFIRKHFSNLFNAPWLLYHDISFRLQIY